MKFSDNIRQHAPTNADDDGGSWIDDALKALPGTLTGVAAIVAAGHAGEQPVNNYTTNNAASTASGQKNLMLFGGIAAVAIAIIVIIALKK